ncbi:MAG TPA: SMP-30/gluconolactonase/LRE family protein [Acidimicrobiia bacterium]|nr:SMP-30/gluconolactonase/LRE family protein [Acidimicrobiia bacterium]
MTAARIPGPPQLLPGRPDAVVDLRTHEGAALVGAEWRYADATIDAVDFVAVGPDLGPSGAPTRTFDVAPHAEAPEFDDSRWRVLQPPELELRLGAGLVSANWYRTVVTIPDRVGDIDPTGATVVFEIVIDDYAEVWVDGALTKAIGDSGGNVASGFNAPNRVVLTTDARPGQSFQLAVFGINGPISSTPRNYIWVRSATLDFYDARRARVGEDAALEVRRFDPRLDSVVPRRTRLEMIATGFEFTEGPVWFDGALLFSAPNTNTIYRWNPEGRVTVFRTKSGYSGVDIGRYHQPGSNGLAVDPEGRLAICQHGNRRVVRVNPHGDLTVLADSFEGKRLNSPNDLVFRSDGTLFFTDPPFGLPDVYEDPKRELPFSGVFRARDGDVRLVTDELVGPNGIAFSPDERILYVGDWDDEHKVVMRYRLDAAGDVVDSSVLADLTDARGVDAIDGIKVDRAGNLFVCGPGGVWVLAPDGARLGLLVLPEDPHNLAWGGPDGTTLFVTALSSVYRFVPPTRED